MKTSSDRRCRLRSSAHRMSSGASGGFPYPITVTTKWVSFFYPWFLLVFLHPPSLVSVVCFRFSVLVHDFSLVACSGVLLLNLLDVPEV